LPKLTLYATRPGRDEYFEFYDTYIRLVPDERCYEMLLGQVDELNEFFRAMSNELAETIHAPFTWSIKQVVGHLIDVERIFGERLHHFSSGDDQPMAGMDQNVYAANNDFSTPCVQQLVQEWSFCRQANICLIERQRPADWDRSGIASAHKVTTRALVWMLVGHVMHHLKILRNRIA
jgi:uncharacterized damage-inducible protein DinB